MLQCWCKFLHSKYGSSVLTDVNKEGVTASYTPVKSKRKDTVPRQESEDDSSRENSSDETETETSNARLFFMSGRGMYQMLPTLLESAATPRLQKTHTCSRTRTTVRPSCLWICGVTGGSNGGRPLCMKCSGSAKTGATTVYSPYGLGIKIIPEPKNTF